ncbi:MAG: AmmeMemoRadiSam system radical SAM enzyme [Candidatus Micrarchaeia archaeon]
MVKGFDDSVEKEPGKLKECYVYEKRPNNIVRCHTCSRRCLIGEGHTGFCLVRKNIKGKLYALNYSKIATMNIDPIGKKPLAHFYPNSNVLSIATMGCNFRCQYCCNWMISQPERMEGEDIPPEKIVQIAKDSMADGISYTYTEPTIFFEICYDTGKLAKKEGLFNTWVTNGYFTKETIDKGEKYIDAMTVDFKASGDLEFYKKFVSINNVEPIYENLKFIKKKGIYFEITDLIVPRVGDDMEDVKALAQWIRENLGKETVLHLLRFYPSYKMMDYPDTPVETLEKAQKIARDYLDYVLIGNVPGHPGENTYCPNCHSLVIGRYGFLVMKWMLDKDNKCLNCGYKIPIIGKLKYPLPSFG